MPTTPLSLRRVNPRQATACEPIDTPCSGDSPRPLSAVYRTRGGTRPVATRAQLGKSREIDAGFKLRDVALIARASEKFVGGADASELASVLPADIPPLNSTSASGSGR